MTYCVGMLLDEGLVMAADTRTNAGVDNVGKFKKLTPGRSRASAVFVLLTAGNLAVTQAVVSMLTEGTQAKPKQGRGEQPVHRQDHVPGRPPRRPGHPRREEDRRGIALAPTARPSPPASSSPARSARRRPRLFQIYSAGNFIEATADTPFFQIGEHKYGKPILDRVARNDMKLGDAAKMVLLSFDSTLRSNLSVGLPIDLLTYETGTLKIEHTKRIGLDDPYFKMLSTEWSKALRTAFANIEALDI